MIRSRWLPVLLWLTVIFVATSIPNPDVPHVTGGDKAAHAIMYGGLALLVARALADVPRWRTTMATLALVALIAAGDEAHQQFIPGRTASLHDWFADVAGAGIALLVSGAVLGRREPAS